MNIKNLRMGSLAVGELVFTDFNDTPENPRPGLGYHHLYDPNKTVSLIAKLPDVTRVGDTITLYWDGNNVQQYDLDEPTITKGWLSFSVSPSNIQAPKGEVFYTLFDHEANDTQTSPVRTVAVNRNSPGRVDSDTGTAINEALVPCTVSPDPVGSVSTSATVSVPAWVNQEVGDELTVMWNNLRVNHPKLITKGPQDVIIPPEVLEQGGSSDKLLVNYEIRDVVDNYSLVSPATYVRVEIDPLALTEPHVQEADITTLVLDLAALGDKDGHVSIPSYAGNGTSYVVSLTWIGKTQTAEIALTLPPQTVEDADFDHATFVIPNADLKQIAGGSAVLRYSISQTGASPDKTSKTTSITLTGLPVELSAPTVTQAGGSDVIDLALFGTDYVTVSIRAYSGQRSGDKILLSWKGTPATGCPVNYTDDYEIKPGEEQKEMTFLVLRENLDPLAHGTLSLSYQVVSSATATTQNSPVMTYRVPAVALAFPARTIVQAPGGLLKPMDATDGATFRATYTSMRDTDTIVPVWDNISDTIPWVPGKPGGSPANTVESTVPAALIGAVVGKMIDVSYQVQRDGQTYHSDVLKLTVEAIPTDQLPTPQIAQASGGSLDVGALQGDADITVDAWPFIAVGQQMWMRIEGSSNLDLPSWQGYVIGSTNAQATTVSLDYLKTLADGSILKLILEVSFDGGLTRQAFPVQSYPIKALPKFFIEDFERYPEQSIIDTFITDDLKFYMPANQSGRIYHEADGNKLRFTLQLKLPAEVLLSAGMDFIRMNPSYVSFEYNSMSSTSSNSWCDLTYQSQGGGSYTQRLLATDYKVKLVEARLENITHLSFVFGHGGPSWSTVFKMSVDNIKWS